MKLNIIIMGNFWKTAGGAAAISGVSGTASGLFGGLFAGRQQKRQYKYNKKLQEQQQAWQEKMFNLENLYNLPKNEIQRLIDAGVNPSLAFNNAGASAAPIPASGSAGGVSAPTVDFGNPGADAVQSAIAAQNLENNTKVAESVADRNDAEAAKLRTDAAESESRKKLNDVLYEIQSSSEYKEAMIEYPSLRNIVTRIDGLTRDLGYSFDLETYGSRIQSVQFSTARQALGFVADERKIRLLEREYDKAGAEIRYLEAGSAQQQAHAAVLRQDLDIRAGEAYLGTLKRDALEYCKEHGVSDAVTGELTPFIDALADEYAAGVSAGTYTSKQKAVTANQESIYQGEHGQERRSAETREITRRANWYRTSQWTMSINAAGSFVKDVVGTVVTRGASAAFSTPRAGLDRMPLSPEAMDVLRKVNSQTEKRLIY